MNKYNPQEIEIKWQKIWEESGMYKSEENPDKPKFYCLDMFPYPSGSGLHVGHWRGYVLSDVVARYQLLNGKNILHPMGWDAFGLPAENAAIKNQSHPSIYTKEAINNIRRQIKQIGTMIDWSREINTSDPSYYKWTQWIFLQLYKNGLAYRKKAPVNWCPSCQTVLANEQVVSGECERCGSQVINKDLTQWFFKITDFADDLLEDLDGLDWPERTKALQRNWIGKSEGVIFREKVKDLNISFEVYDSVPQTFIAQTFAVIAPDHPLLKKLVEGTEHEKPVMDFVEKINKKKLQNKFDVDKDLEGIFTGRYVDNPFGTGDLPIWVASYVLSDYGTGIVNCSAHDERDFNFAKKYDIPLNTAMLPKDSIRAEKVEKLEIYYGRDPEGILQLPEELKGMKWIAAKEKSIDYIEKKELGYRSTQYKIRDWLISRQRYWGAPIPIVYCDKCGEMPVLEDQLPIELPDDVEFKPHGKSPLKESKKFLYTKCPSCGGQATRETDTMDTFVCSSWYYLRYADPTNANSFADKDKVNYWLPVDFYFGGIEHAVLHLLYARFISKALTKLGIIDYDDKGEPFKRLFNIGMIYLHGAKMSKSKGNVVSPDELIEKYGTDALRGYEMFIGPADLDSEWQVQGISGVYRFLEKVWNIYNSELIDSADVDPLVEKTIKTVTLEIESVHPNTAISHLMELFNHLSKNNNLSKQNAERIAILLSPFFPHLSEELWQILGKDKSVFAETWPAFNEEILSEEKIKLPIQINGKVRDIIEINSDMSEEEILNLAKSTEKIKSAISESRVIKTVYIPLKIVNIVIE
ncbi:TPA: leucine--tRNA ligase [Candidatus Berkelbacteria bacterium]|uniref:Leucine--tRNA ligase n=1 Tax=Berkelbacteria bacterium GW2011_GWE1_39_12 TaxID=1618337 RepID=A0A0G4B5C8_9BACT|nr:MAG: leucyl-tRNA synthetase, leucyl-tRNA synthetase [Berkelbacteria bacterium GW2011_GWE1_39_12]HBO60159.1 leucine--tRNA ligase [Candidatus Berkelbacteria bacterium]